MITFSALPRLSVCPASAVLPAVQEDTSDSRVGTARHAYLAAIPRLGEGAAIELVPEEHRDACARIDLSGLPLDPKRYVQEVAFALDLKTGKARELGHNLERRYPELRAGEIAGTIDVLGVLDDRVYIGDFKGEHDETMPLARRNHQLLAGAVAAARIYDRQSATVELIHLRDDGSHWKDTAALDVFDLAAALEELGDIAARVARAEKKLGRGKSPNVTRGDHCRWCPAFRSCPATLTLAKEIAEGLSSTDPTEAIAAEVRASLTPERAALSLERVRLLEKIVATVKDELKAFARAHPIALPEGRVYGPRQKEQIKSGIAIAVLTRRFGPDVARTASRFSTSKDAIRRSISPIADAQEVSVKELEREIFAEIREAGGFEIVEEIREYTHA